MEKFGRQWFDRTRVVYEDTEHYQITRDFLNNRERYFKHLFSE